MSSIILIPAAAVLLFLCRKLFLRIQSPLWNIPGPPSPSFWTGNILQFADRAGWSFLQGLSNYGGVVKHYGPMGEQRLYISDPLAIHHILVKDNHLYPPMNPHVTRLILGDGLISSEGDQHKRQRKILNPAFSNLAMRDLYPVFLNIGIKLQNAISTRVEAGPREIDMLHWMSRTALEFIGQAGLGTSFDPLVNDSGTSTYAESIQNLAPSVSRLIRFQDLARVVVRLGTPQIRRRLMDSIPWKALHQLRDTVDLIDQTSTQIITRTKNELDGKGADVRSEQIGQGKDIMSILMKSNMGAAEEKRLTDSEVVGQVSVFTLAAVSPTGSALTRILHLLSLYPEIQDQLRAELLNARILGEKDIDYDTLVNLPLLDAICRETLRLYPPLSVIARRTSEDAVLPLAQPISGIDGTPMNQVHIPKDTRILIGILASNRNPKIWGPDVLEWKPHRWLSSLPGSVGQAHLPGVYSHLMTFSGGSRSCIGFKFAQLEMKVVLSHLIQSFRFSAARKDIYWNLSGTAFPTVDGANDMPSLPLMVAKL